MSYDIDAFAEAFGVVGCAIALRRGDPVPATYDIGSDRYPYTVVGVVGDQGRTLLAQRDRTRGIGVFLVDVDDDREPERFTLRKDGRYRSAGRDHGTLWIGRRELYLDPSF